SGDLTFCAGESVTLTASGADSYTWNTGATGSSLVVSQTGDYSVEGTLGSCSSSSSVVSVLVNALPTASITASGPLTFCEGENVTLSVPSGDTYLWSNGATTASIQVNTSGTYSVVVTNASGCSTQSTQVEVVVNTLPTASITASGSLTFCEGEDV